ncbi:hypothetical protein BRADI_3g14026v3 [Brachypodium distachyon]|uniref:Uncharacterized protein n=1 Tax=Brachypodium distachyon TaxID=15368 RepID=A0A2K2CWZ2_BRADI|nr:hypothetical protein BRADI_3g14026v3 [Brachypodium distachyon]
MFFTKPSQGSRESMDLPWNINVIILLSFPCLPKEISERDFLLSARSKVTRMGIDTYFFCSCRNSICRGRNRITMNWIGRNKNCLCSIMSKVTRTGIDTCFFHSHRSRITRMEICHHV